MSLTLDGVLFQEDLCSTLSMLHSYAPVHSFEYTRKEVEKALGQRIEDVFDSFDPEPIASGSIAQVRGGHWQAGHEEEQWRRRRRRSPRCCDAVTWPACIKAGVQRGLIPVVHGGRRWER